MADEIETPDDETPVIVGDVIEAPDEIIDAPVTVIVEADETPAESSDAVDAVVIDNAIDVAGRLAVIEDRLSRVEGQATIAEITADIALDATEELAEADAEIITATDEAIVETVEGAEIEEGRFGEEDEISTDETAPLSTRVHPVFRSWSDWRAGRNS